MRRAIIFASLIFVVAAGAADVVTDENFDKLRVGMYRQQVTEILGWPDESGYESYEGETILVWTYHTEASMAAALEARSALYGGASEQEILKTAEEGMLALESITVIFKYGTYVDPASGYTRPNTLILVKAVMITPGGEKLKTRSIGEGFDD